MSTDRARGREREAEYRRVFLECAMRLYCQYPDMSEVKALTAASVFVAELRQHDGQADTQACPEKGDERKDSPYVVAAITRYAENSNGDIEVDLDAVISEADGGAFVQMWGWVDNADLP